MPPRRWTGVVAQNRSTARWRKIRVVSVSAAPGNAEMFQNADLWDAAVARAEQAGLLVLTVDGAGVEKTRLVPYPAVLARNDRDNPAACRTGFADSDERAETGSNTLSLPCSYRTVAEEYTAGQYSYTHDGHGGLSWGIPYCAGVMALGWQVDPTPDGRGNDASTCSPPPPPAPMAATSLTRCSLSKRCRPSAAHNNSRPRKGSAVLLTPVPSLPCSGSASRRACSKGIKAARPASMSAGS